MPIELSSQNTFNGQEEIVTKVYKEACRRWKETENHYAKIIAGKEEYKNAGETAEIYRAWSLTGRYLGIDNGMRENREKFAAIMRNGLFVDFHKQKLQQRIDIYREVTADRFMYTIMKMTPFTYLNMAASIIPDINLQGSNLERIIMVLYTMSVKCDENGRNIGTREENIKVYRCAMMSMWKEFVAYCGEMLAQQNGSADLPLVFSEIVAKIEKCGQPYVDKSLYDAQMWEQLIKDVINAAKSDAGGKKEILIHIKKICDLLRSIMEMDGYYIDQLEGQTTIKNDYLKGREHWRKIFDNLHEEKDGLIQELLTISVQNKDFLQTLHYKTGVVDRKELNEADIKFLLRSYYRQKIKDSRAEA